MSDAEEVPQDPDQLGTARQFGRYLAAHVRGELKQQSLANALGRIDPQLGIRRLTAQRISGMENAKSLPTGDELRAYVHGCGKPEQFDLLDRVRRKLRQQLIDADNARETEAARTAEAAAERPEPPIAALPPAAGSFTGRTGEMERLLRSVDASVGPGGIVAGLYAIDGMAGIGKTTFAVQAAHRLARSFPDGQVFLQLNGHNPLTPPIDAHQALATLLVTTGVDPRGVHDDPQARIAQWRSWMAGKRMVLVLDDAADSGQVRPLIPAEPGVLVLITSRQRLRALGDTDPISLDVLSPDEAAVLFTRVARGRGLDPADEQVARAVALCGYLPLALDLAANRLKHRPAWSCADLADQLATSARPLSPLQVEDRSVAAAFDLSYRDLTADQQRLFRRLGMHPGPDIDAYAAAALDDGDVATTRGLLEELEDHRLIEERTRGRYRMHDLIREHARARTATDVPEPEADQQAALTRIFDHYLHTAAIAMDTLYAFDEPLRPRVPRARTPAPSVADSVSARAWLAAEHDNIVVTASYTATRGWAAHAGLLSGTLWRHFEVTGHYNDAMTVHRRGLDAVRALGDRGAEGRVLGYLGTIYWLLGQYSEALEHHKQALPLVQQSSDRVGEGQVLGNLGIVCWQLGRFVEAVDHFQRSLELRREAGYHAGVSTVLGNLGAAYVHLGRNVEAVETFRQTLELQQELGHRVGEGITLGNLGFLYARLGRYEESIDHSVRALAIHREVDNHPTESYALGNLGLVYGLLGRFNEALEYYQEALVLMRECSDRPGEGHVLSGLAVLYDSMGRYQEAMDHHEQAVAIGREIGDEGLEAEACSRRADTLRALRRFDEAEREYRAALDLSRKTGDRYEQARALDGLARALHATGRVDEARELRREALGHYAEMGIDEPGE